MARENRQKVRGSWQCQVPVKNYWDEDEPCGKPKRSHSDKVKHGVTDHPYGGEDGTLIGRVLPTCGACSRELEPGEEYRLWAPRHGGKKIRCMTCPAPSRSSMTSSEILAMAWDIVDEDIDATGMESIEDFEALRDDYASRIQDVVDLIQEKLDNIEAGTGHTGLPVYEELEERRDMYEEWQQEVAAVDFEQAAGDSEACAECGLGETDCGASDDDHEFEAESELDVDQALELLQEALDQCPE